MKLIFGFLLLFSFPIFAQVCTPKETSFTAIKIENNLVTHMFQVSLPFYQKDPDHILYLSPQGAAEKHLCTFLGLAGGRILGTEANCNATQQILIREDGAYVEAPAYSEGGCLPHITMMECAPSWAAHMQ
jgi:hypothetical protein